MNSIDQYNHEPKTLHSLEPSNSSYILTHMCKEPYKCVHWDHVIAGKNCAVLAIKKKKTRNKTVQFICQNVTIADKTNTVPLTYNSVNKWKTKRTCRTIVQQAAFIVIKNLHKHHYYFFTDTMMFVKVFKMDQRDTEQSRDSGGFVVWRRGGVGKRCAEERPTTLSVPLQLLYFFFLTTKKKRNKSKTILMTINSGGGYTSLCYMYYSLYYSVIFFNF